MSCGPAVAMLVYISDGKCWSADWPWGNCWLVSLDVAMVGVGLH